MRRLTIEGDIKRHGPTATGGDHWVVESDQGVLLELWVRDATPGVTITVEDIPDPLPTELGETFWGHLTSECGVRAQRFFVCASQQRTGKHSYVATDGFRVEVDEVQTLGLVRLPDPEATS